MSEDTAKLIDRIWITEKCHMNAEKRNRFRELYFHISLAIYSIASIWEAILNISGLGEGKSEAVLVSIVTLCLSLLIFGFKFGETAAGHRRCYLELQTLRGEVGMEYAALNKSYILILSNYDNHSPSDYMKLALTNLFKSQQKLKSGDKAVEFGFWQRARYAVTRFSLFLIASAFILYPIITTLSQIEF